MGDDSRWRLLVERIKERRKRMETSRNEPNATTKIQLAKGLKLQKRLAGRFNEVSQKIQLKNSVLKEQQADTNLVPSLLEQKKALSLAIVDLKAALYAGNSGIQNQLYTLAEKKGEADFYRGLNTRTGIERHSYQNTSVEYVAFITEEVAQAQVRQLEGEIDRMQDSIDEYNHTTRITIQQSTLDLGS